MSLTPQIPEWFINHPELLYFPISYVIVFIFIRLFNKNDPIDPITSGMAWAMSPFLAPIILIVFMLYIIGKLLGGKE